MDVNQKELEYKWFDAAKYYEQTLSSRADDVSFAGQVWHRVGFCYSQASRQAECAGDFKRLRQLAVEAYERAAALFRDESNLQNQGREADCLALAQYTRSWLASNSLEKARMLDECRAYGKKALEAFKKSGDELSFGRTCTMLSLCLYERLSVVPTLAEKGEIIQEGLNKLNDAILVLSKLKSKEELLFALSEASILCWYLANISELEEERKIISKKCLSYSESAANLSRETDNAHLKAMSTWARALSTLFFTEKIDSAWQYATEMLQHAAVTRDNYFKGIAFYLMAHITDWMVAAEADPDIKKQRYKEIIEYSENSIRHLQLVCRDSDIAETYLFYSQSYAYLASDFAFKPLEKLAFSKKAVRIGERGLECAIRSGSVDALGSILHGLSKAYHYYSSVEPRKEEKPELLKSALGYRREYINTVEQAFTCNNWALGVGMVYAAEIEKELARLEKDEGAKMLLLGGAISDIESGVECCNKWVGSRGVPSQIATVAGFEDTFAGMLNEQYVLTQETANLSRASELYSDAAEKFKEVDLPSRVAESYWKIARNLDLSGDYQKAAKNFENAFAGYKAAAQKIHQFSEFYLEYATYMKAWSEIQTAKFAHSKENYDSAMKHYERTSDLLKQSRLWGFLSSNFQAWSRLEQAEDLSRKESCIEAAEAFRNAIKLFQESQQSLQTQLIEIDRVDEKDLVINLIEASNVREEYSQGRIEIERARTLDKQGDYEGSSEKYELAAAIFQKLLQARSEQTRKEAKPLVYLCKAWQRMSLAEARRSPIMYEEAAELFKVAGECSTTESARLLALANSNFCKALETGTEFEITRNAMMYTQSSKFMDAAASYYLKAGFEPASEYAKATQRLFDAYVYMNSAKRETEPEKEAKHYLMAEKMLQNSVESFAKARHTEKTVRVQKLLEKVKEERELALSLSEVFHAPTITSSTASFATISLSEEKAVGLERFEHADIQAKLIQHERDVKVGEETLVEIQVINVGKEPVFLTKIENIVPEGFQVANKTSQFPVEDAHVIMKGKRLDPLKVEEIKITLKSFKRGTYEIKPRIIYVDEVGNQLVHELENSVFNVLEASLQGRVTTGYENLDNLMLGGIPENYSVVMTSPSCDERELLIARFLEAGTEKNQITFYVAAEPGTGRALAEAHPSDFYLFVCNPRADVMIKNLPNVCKIKGVESLTDIDIALTKSFRVLNELPSGPRRACIEIVSDVLLQHHAVTTRKWLSGLLPDLKSKGFTTLAIINPQMHPPEEVQAILGLFEGEIRISEKETSRGIEKILRIRKLCNQRYLENELMLKREELES